MGDEYWYPLLREDGRTRRAVDDPVLSLHACHRGLNSRFHFINEESIAVVSLINSKVFEHFPKLKIVVAHGGGAIPYPHGQVHGRRRYQSRRDMARRQCRRTAISKTWRRS